MFVGEPGPHPAPQMVRGLKHRAGTDPGMKVVVSRALDLDPLGAAAAIRQVCLERALIVSAQLTVEIQRQQRLELGAGEAF